MLRCFNSKNDSFHNRGKKGSPTSKVALPPPDHLIVQQSTEEMDAEGVRQRKEGNIKDQDLFVHTVVKECAIFCNVL